MAQLFPTTYDELTYKDTGGDYDNMALWYAGECQGVDMVTATRGQVLRPYTKSDGGAYDDTITMLLGTCTTNAEYFSAIIAADGHRGTKTTGARFENTTAVANVILSTGIGHTTFARLGVKAVTTSIVADSAAIGIRVVAGGGKVVENTTYDCTSVSVDTGAGIGIFINNTTAYIACNFITGSRSGASTTLGAGLRMGNTGTINRTVYSYANTIYDNDGYDIRLTKTSTGTLTVEAKNVLYHTAGGTGAGSTLNETTCQDSATATLAADGYHLAAATNDGTDLRTDGVWAVLTDIDGDAYAATPSIGCDQWVAAGGIKFVELIVKSFVAPIVTRLLQ